MLCLSATFKFQSTLPRGERRFNSAICGIVTDFNPRSHGGSDNNYLWLLILCHEISIHAPTGGATYCSALQNAVQPNFNPRSHGGSDIKAKQSLSFVKQFQSTLPRGERHVPCCGGKSSLYFNPRSHGGSDNSLL